MESSIVSLVLAQALVILPKITAAELYVKCEGQIGTTSLPQFRIELSKWLTDGTIPGYEARLGRTGGIYRKGAANVSLNSGEKQGPQLDPAPIASFIEEYLKTNPRITVSDLMTKVDIAPLTEAQFRQQMSAWLNDDKTFPLFETHKGPTGGIYLKGSTVEKWIPSVDESDDGETEHSNGFAVQVSPTIKILHSDERNWVVQKLSGNTWVNKAYHPDIVGCLNSVVKHAINGEFKLADTSLVQLKDLAKVFKQIEERIVGHLQSNMQVQAQA